jgi:hypothetical protein
MGPLATACRRNKQAGHNNNACLPACLLEKKKKKKSEKERERERERRRRS